MDELGFVFKTIVDETLTQGRYISEGGSGCIIDRSALDNRNANANMKKERDQN
jgi:hypothetical protein